MTVRQLYPGYKEIARRFLAGGPGTFIADEDMAKVFGGPPGSKVWNVQRMLLGDHLRNRCGGEGLVRDKERKGFRLATDEEKVNHLAVRELGNVVRALDRQRTYLVGADPAALSSEATRQRDHMLTTGGVLQAMVMRAQAKLLDGTTAEGPAELAEGGDGEDEAA